MKTITITHTTTETKTTTKEYLLPYFGHKKTENIYYPSETWVKVTQDDAMEIYFANFGSISPTARISSITNCSSSIDGTEEITQEEFDAAFNKVLTHLQSI